MKMTIDVKKWRQLELEGINLSRILFSIKFQPEQHNVSEVTELRQKYLLWLQKIKRLANRPEFEKVSGYLYEGDGVVATLDRPVGMIIYDPRKKTSIMRAGPFTKVIVETMIVELKDKLRFLRELSEKMSPGLSFKHEHRLVMIDAITGDYLYSGKPIVLSKGSLQADVFDIIFQHCDQRGYVSYKEIELALQEKGHRPLDEKNYRDKRIQNAIRDFFHRARVGDSRIMNKLEDGRQLIALIRGKGVRLNNPSV